MIESVLVALILSSLLASVFFGLTRALDALNGSSRRNLGLMPVKIRLSTSPEHMKMGKTGGII
jgi:hypothetical protein